MLRFEIGLTGRKKTLQLNLSSLYRCAFICPCLTNVVVIICSLDVLSVGFIDVEIIGKERQKRIDKIYSSLHLDISPFFFTASTKSYCYYNYCFLVDNMSRRNLKLMVDQE